MCSGKESCSVANKLTSDLKKLANSHWVLPLTKQLNTYEVKAKALVKEFDLKSRDARDKSKARLDEILGQLKKTRGEVETKVRTVFEEESKRLNARVTELFGTLRTLAQLDPVEETKKAKAAVSEAKPAKKKKTAARKASPSAPKKARKVAKADVETNATAH